MPQHPESELGPFEDNLGGLDSAGVDERPLIEEIKSIPGDPLYKDAAFPVADRQGRTRYVPVRAIRLIQQVKHEVSEGDYRTLITVVLAGGVALSATVGIALAAKRGMHFGHSKNRISKKK